MWCSKTLQKVMWTAVIMEFYIPFDSVITSSISVILNIKTFLKIASFSGLNFFQPLTAYSLQIQGRKERSHARSCVITIRCLSVQIAKSISCTDAAVWMFPHTMPLVNSSWHCDGIDRCKDLTIFRQWFFVFRLLGGDTANWFLNGQLIDQTLV